MPELKAGGTAEISYKTDPRYSRKALIVGINEYEDPTNNLNGCINDAMDVYDTLLICGFPKTRRKLLLNEKATTVGIIEELEKLVKGAEAGDVLVFYYSGHGSQVTDLDGDEATADRLDEIICPHDIDFGEGNYISDDMLNDIFSDLPKGIRCDVILDSCFSGTATRSLHRIVGGAVLPETKRQRYMQPPRDMLGRINTSIPSRTKVNHVGTSAVSNAGASLFVEMGSNNDVKAAREKDVIPNQLNSLWSACQDYQVAWELDMGGEIRGAFTYTLMKILRRSNGNIPRQKIYEIMRTTMSNEGFEQIPGLEPGSQSALAQYPFRRPIDDEPAEVAEQSGSA